MNRSLRHAGDYWLEQVLLVLRNLGRGSRMESVLGTRPGPGLGATCKKTVFPLFCRAYLYDAGSD